MSEYFGAREEHRISSGGKKNIDLCKKHSSICFLQGKSSDLALNRRKWPNWETFFHQRSASYSSS